MTMSNVTSQARQSVAKNLRYLARCYTPEGGLEKFRAALEDELFTGAGHRDYTEIFARLAELIDPEECTCHVSKEFIDHEPTLDSLGIVWFECDKCGWGWYEGDVCHYPSKPHYCPHCGARVVNDASDAEA